MTSHAVVRLLPALVAARAVVPLAVRAVSLPDLLARAPLNVAEPAVAVLDAVAVVRRFEAALRVLPRASGTCLTRSLWRAIALRRAGVPVDFVLGVRTDARGHPEGHAWLELDGAPLLERRPEELVHFARAWTHTARAPTNVGPSAAQFVAAEGGAP
jgi:hypothetical protein